MWEPPPQAYFEAIAQLVPLLFLTALFQARTYDSDEGHGPAGPFTLLAALLTLVVALFAALASIVDPSRGSTIWATYGVAFAVAAILNGVLYPRGLRIQEQASILTSTAFILGSVVVILTPLGLATWGVAKLT